MKEEKLGITVGAIALVGLLGALAWWTLSDGDGPTSGGGPGGGEPGEWQPPPDPEAIRIVREATSDEISAFGSPAELGRYLAQLGQAATSVQEHERAWREAHPPPPHEAMAQPVMAEAPSATEPSSEPASDGADESITNTQEAGVDEGGIVKTHGEHLVVLRRGRLFSTRLGEPGQLEPLSMIDAPPPHVEGGWYDEMLIHGDTIIVVGFNYQQAGTELGFFHIDSDGQITRRETYYLRSNDYYSSANYASRLVGDTLLFYMPYGLLSQRSDGNRVGFDATLPGLRRGRTGEWTEIMAARTIYRPLQPALQPQLHTVVACDLSQPELRCTARGILGPAGRTFYVSPDAVYVWVGPDWWEMQARAEGDAVPHAVVYRLPLGADGAVGAMRVLGMPVDQFSFKEADGYLNVVVRAEGGGDGMWAPQVSDGDLALLRVPLAAFSDGVTVAPSSAYTPLPIPGGWTLVNRFVGDRLVYGSSTALADDTHGGRVFVHDYARRGEPTVVAVEHGVERIDVLGQHAVVIGASSRGLSFSAVSLGNAPSVVGSYTREGAAQGEQRSHGFFYRATGEDAGNLGLPIRSNGVNGQYTENGSAGVLFLSVTNRERVLFAPLGTLEAHTLTTEDQCIASCTDWYGNARPIFYRGRVFALLGYELVEGRLGDGLQEIGRTNLYEDQPAVRGSEAPPTR